MSKNIEIFSETLANISKKLIEKEIDEIISNARTKFEESLMKERVRLMASVTFYLRRDAIGDRIVYTLEFKPKDNEPIKK